MATPEQAPKVRITLDRMKCCGYALCAAEAPDVYSVDDLGFADFSRHVPLELEDQAQLGAEVCPAEALTVERVFDETES